MIPSIIPHTPWKTNMDPENGYLEDEFPLPTSYFGGLAVSFPGCITHDYCRLHLWTFRVEIRHLHHQAAVNTSHFADVSLELGPLKARCWGKVRAGYRYHMSNDPYSWLIAINKGWSSNG